MPEEDPAPNPTTPSESPSHRRLAIGIGAVLVIAAVAAYPTIYYHLSHVVTDDAYVTGNLVTLSASVDGRITELHVFEGDTVDRGRVLARIDTATYAAEVTRAQASVDRARSRLAEATILLEREKNRAGPLAEQYAAEVDAAQARFTSAAAADGQSARTLQRVDRLSQSGLVSESELDHARSTHRRRSAELDEARELVHKAEALVRLSDGNLDAVRLQHQRVQTSRSELRLAEAGAERWQIRLDATQVRSSVHGVVARLTVHEGELVEEGQTIGFIRDLDTLWVVANVEETRIQNVCPGQPVEITVDAFPDRRLTGRVARIGSVTSSQFAVIPRESFGGNFVKVVQRVPVAIAVDDTSGTLKLGLSAVVGIDVRRRP